MTLFLAFLMNFLMAAVFLYKVSFSSLSIVKIVHLKSLSSKSIICNCSRTVPIHFFLCRDHTFLLFFSMPCNILFKTRHDPFEYVVTLEISFLSLTKIAASHFVFDVSEIIL